MLPSFFKKKLCLFLEKSLNYYLRLDPESALRIEKLSGKVIHVELLGIGVHFQFQFVNHTLRLLSESHLPADTYISGTPFSLLHLSVSQDRQRFFADDVTITGDLEAGQQMIALFDQLEIDWEEYMSHYFGDVLAHQLGRVGQNIKQFGRSLRSNLRQNINEYVHEEIEIFPPQILLQKFLSDVDELRMDVDRITARIVKLRKDVL